MKKVLRLQEKKLLIKRIYWVTWSSPNKNYSKSWFKSHVWNEPSENNTNLHQTTSVHTAHWHKEIYIFLTNTMATQKDPDTLSPVLVLSAMFYFAITVKVLSLLFLSKKLVDKILQQSASWHLIWSILNFVSNWCIFHMCVFFFFTGTKLLAKLKM